MSLSKTRAWVAGTVVVCLLLTVAAWFLLISPKRAEAADLNAQTVTAQENNDRTRLEIDQLKAEFAKLAQHQYDLAALREALPLDDKENVMIRSLDAAAAASGVALDSIAATAPTGAAAAAPAPAPAAGGTTPAPAAQVSVVQIPVTIVVTGPYQGSLEFLKQLQTSVGRDYLVSGLTISEAQLDGNSDVDSARAEGWVTMTITGSMFALPESALAAAAPAAATAPAAAPAATNN